MFSLIDIVRRDAATYYNYDTSLPVRRWRSLIVFLGFSLSIGFMVQRPSNDFLSGALSAQAILVGFSFNVLFYLVANRLTTPVSFSGIEHELRFERLSKLSDEVFDNVTYFNLVAILSAVAALGLLLANCESFDHNLHHIAAHLEKQRYIGVDVLSKIKTVFFCLSLSILLFLIIESLYTFLRAVGRVRFYFKMLKTMNDES